LVEVILKIQRVRLNKEQLERIPARDRTLLLLLGHVCNEINVLQKLILMTMRQTDCAPSPVIDMVQTGQAHILTRVLIGKLHEAWLLLQKRVHADRDLVERYELDGNWPGKKLLKCVNKHFNDNTELSMIRNKLSFHYYDEDGLMEKSFNALPAGEPLDLFMPDAVANRFYHASELLVTLAALSPTGSYDPEWSTKLGELLDATIAGADLIMKLFQELMVTIMNKSISGGVYWDEVEIGEPGSLSEQHVPFFVRP
jgi:hypothetical protein